MYINVHSISRRSDVFEGTLDNADCLIDLLYFFVKSATTLLDFGFILNKIIHLLLLDDTFKFLIYVLE
jgi:hypothetical protein